MLTNYLHATLTRSSLALANYLHAALKISSLALANYLHATLTRSFLALTIFMQKITAHRWYRLRVEKSKVKFPSAIHTGVKGKIKKDRMAYVRQWQWRKKQHRENLRGKSEVDRQGVPKLCKTQFFQRIMPILEK